MQLQERQGIVAIGELAGELAVADFFHEIAVEGAGGDAENGKVAAADELGEGDSFGVNGVE